MKAQQAELKRLKKDREYYEGHREQLLRQYPEQWVASFNEQVVAADSDVDRLLTALKARGIPTEKALIERVTAQDELLVVEERTERVLLLEPSESDALHLP